MKWKITRTSFIIDGKHMDRMDDFEGIEGLWQAIIAHMFSSNRASAKLILRVVIQNWRRRC